MSDQVERGFATMTEWQPSEGTKCLEKKVTRDSEAKECDINTIVLRAEKTGLLPDFGRGPGQFEDVTAMTSYQDALAQVQLAESEFMRLPLAVRRHFDHDPVAFLDACQDPARRGELEELGLVEKAQEAAPVEPVPGAGGTPA